VSETQLRSLPGAKFSCQGCGKCCTGFSFGPVEPKVIQGLIDQDMASKWAPAQEGPWYHEHPGPDGTPVFSLAHRDGHCVFLRPDKLCAIHAELGEPAKPWFCREYPVRFVQDAKGLSATIRADCGGFSTSYASGQPLDEQLEAALSLPRPVSYPRFDPEHVEVLPGMAISPENWLQLESPLMSKVQIGGAGQGVAPRRGGLARGTERAIPQTSPAAAAEVLAYPLDQIRPHVEAKLAAILPGELTPRPETDPDFYRHVLLSDLLAKRFAAVGSLPAGLGLTLLEVQLAEALGGPAHLAQVQRLIQVPENWKAIKAAKPYLTQLFLAWPAIWPKQTQA
jgi:Fe-S-cluster containining protein